MTDPVLRTEGVITQLHTLYAGLPSGRLAILGGPGSGKTSAAVLPLLAALRHRQARPEMDRSGVPIPVILSLESWNPGRTGDSLREWAAAKIYRDHRYLRADAYGPRADETGVRVALTSRAPAYEKAVERGHLQTAAVFELLPIEPSQAAAFLREVSPGWSAFATFLLANPRSAVATALNTPLALWLLQTTYRTAGDPLELTDPRLFPDARSVITFSLDRVPVNAWLRPVAQARPGMTPHAAFSLDLRATWAAAVAGGLAGTIAGLVGAAGDWVSAVEVAALVAFAVPLTVGLGPALWLVALGLYLRLRGRGPLRPMRFLEDARHRQILRQAGSVYQFRHAELQDHLANHYAVDIDRGTAR